MFTDYFEVVDAVAAAEGFEEDFDAFFFAGPGEDGDGLTYNLFGIIAEDAGGGRVPGGDGAGEGHAEDGVVGGGHDGGEPAFWEGNRIVFRVLWEKDAIAHSWLEASALSAHSTLSAEIVCISCGSQQPLVLRVGTFNAVLCRCCIAISLDRAGECRSLPRPAKYRGLSTPPNDEAVWLRSR